MESLILLSLNCCCSGLFLLYKWSAVAQQIKNCNKAPDLLEKSKFHPTRVYWFSSSQCKIMHLKLFCRAAHLYTPLPFSPVLGTESVKGDVPEESNVMCGTEEWEHSTWSNSRMLSLAPTSFSVTGFLYDILLVLKFRKRKRESQTYLLKPLRLHPTSFGENFFERESCEAEAI